MRFKRLHKVLTSYKCLLLIMVSFALAEIFASFGILNDFKTCRSCLRNISVIILYLSAGLHSQKEPFKFFKCLRIFVTTHIFNFVMVPIIIRFLMFGIAYFADVDKWIITGFIALGCFSPPLSSAVILTKVSNGNELASVINSAFGCLIGAILTPVLLLLHVGVSCILPVGTTLIGIVLFGAVPLFFGCLIQYSRILNKFYWMTQELACNVATFLLIFTSFYETFLETELVISAHEVLITLVTVLLLQVILMCLSVQFAITTNSKQNDINSEDLVAIMFGSVNKSLTIGLPLLKTLYGGYSHLSQISLPLLMYYPVQFILGALLSPFAKGWISSYINKS